MKPLVLSLPGNEAMAAKVSSHVGWEPAKIELRHFPDGETYLRYLAEPQGRPAVLVCTLDRPDAKLLPLVFAARTARSLGASAVGLIAPYLAYMRQDQRFHDGEAITSEYFAAILSREIDWLVTVDPHLHRHRALSEIYAVPTAAIHASSLLAEWIGREVQSPFLIGPDEESEQWVSGVAALANAPYVVARKNRRGDRLVDISFPDLSPWSSRTPVLLDDIVSAGMTMIESVDHLLRHGFRSPVCIAVHGIFADGADQALIRRGARVATCNTIPHPTNEIDVSALIAAGASELLAAASPAGQQGRAQSRNGTGTKNLLP